ncbi:thiosulfate oxidation carrier protein SoxY [Crenalkalicoccus roseus]|uniref:thiosulfate oxidation carrier protein SoxY n=1 Tax=Crenalkalicoccus roseus TaxID=1485588 RepID=UPI0010807210|nr:thiosulfate oxidation carrier protein SoxY [Crenalkalicoccus roseus]
MTTASRRALLLALVALPAAARADAALEAAMREAVGPAEPEEGGMALRLPALAENGAQVPLTVTVDSPMTAEQHVVSIHLFATRNPTPGVASFHLSPALARAEVQTRIRLAEDQQVVALAVLSDGRVLRATAETRVAVGGCLG